MVKYDSELTYDDYDYLADYSLIGTSDGSIFYKNLFSNDIFEFDIQTSNLVYRQDLLISDENSIILTDSNNESSIYSCDDSSMPNTAIYLDNQDNLVCIDGCQPFYGYFNSIEIIDEIYICNSDLILKDDNLNMIQSFSISTFDISIGDIDFDGLDEILWTENGKLMAININGTIVNGFPIDNNYSGIVLIVEDENENIVLVVRSDSHIDIISLDGEILYSLPSISDNDILAISGKLTDGIRFYDFSIGEGSFWRQRYSSHSHYPLATGNHEFSNSDSINQMITKFYNYPNPIINGQTKFRFMVHKQTSVNINIFNINGYKVDQLTLSNPIINEYNEIVWNTGSLESGLYFAEIISNDTSENIIKIVIGR